MRRSVEGSTLKVIPIDSPWKNGVTERHGGIAKQILYKLVDQMSVTDESVFQMCVAAAAQAKNSLSRVCGYSPVQWVLGKEPSTAFSVLDSPHQLACHDRLLRGGKFAIQSQIREAARVAWIQLDDSDRFRRAILRNPTLQRQSFFPGEQVFIFQYGEWRGPCVVVAEQPHRILWVSFRKPLLKVSLEHVRAATSEEILGKQMVDEELDDQFIHLERNGQSRGYVDLTEQGPVVPPGRCRVLGKRPPPPDWVEPEPNVPPALRPTEDFHEPGGGGNLENFDGCAPNAPDSTGEFFQADLPVPENHDSQVSPQYERWLIFQKSWMFRRVMVPVRVLLRVVRKRKWKLVMKISGMLLNLPFYPQVVPGIVKLKDMKKFQGSMRMRSMGQCGTGEIEFGIDKRRGSTRRLSMLGMKRDLENTLGNEKRNIPTPKMFSSRNWGSFMIWKIINFRVIILRKRDVLPLSSRSSASVVNGYMKS